MIGRRTLLRNGLALAGAGATFGRAPLALALNALPARRVGFNHLHTGERLDVTYYEKGAYVSGALDEVNHVLRDWRTGDVHIIEPKLLDLLTALQVSLDVPQTEFGVICGYRSPATNEALHEKSSQVASGSLHLKGQAIDLRVPGRTSAQVRDAAMNLAVGGVGYYSVSDFVHVDVGRVRHWSGT